MSQLAPILVVEDDRHIQSDICDAIALTGFPAIAADHGGIALEIVQRERIALVLLDMKMPIVDGWAFSREYRARIGARAPIVVLTAARDAAAWAAEVGAVAYLAKPFELDELLKVVERHAVHLEAGPAETCPTAE